MALQMLLKNSCKHHQGISNTLQNLLKGTSIVTATKYNTIWTDNRNNNLMKIKNKNLLLNNNNNNKTGVIVGPQIRFASENYSKLWNLKKGIATSVIFTTPAMLVINTPFFDTVFAISMIMHNHWGIEACITDYAQPRWVGIFVQKILLVACYVVSTLALSGLIYFNYHGDGISNTLKALWTVCPADSSKK